MRARWIVLLLAGGVGAASAGCSAHPERRAERALKPVIRPADQAPARTPAPTQLPAINRVDFNRLAVLLDRPLSWDEDARNPGVLDPQELVVLGVGSPRAVFVNPNGFTSLFWQTYASMAELRRREAVARELDQGRLTVIRTDLSGASKPDQQLVRHISAVARLTEQLYAKQRGSFDLAACMPRADLASTALFRRNQGPWCENPATESDPFCNACPGLPPKRSGLYPAGLQADPDFCRKLAAHSNAKELMAPFRAVQGTSDNLKAVPYHLAWPELTRAVAAKLRAAAGLLDEKEKPLREYLAAAATGFETDDWAPADEAWVKMNGDNSRWYLRIAPDEVYFEPCNAKAGYQVSFGRIDPDAKFWQERITPHRDAMEQTLAKLIGPPYAARALSFRLPDFMEVVLNAGDARHATGAVIGESLPNWGKVAEEGRGRTVVMTNLYTDPDSKTMRRAQAESLLDPSSMGGYSEDKRLTLLDIILHEASHNFGPHSDYKIEGRDPVAVFGGPTASVLEELKSQTAGMFFVDFLKEKGLLTDDEVRQVYTHAVVWCFGHISRGMFEADGRPKPYSQLSAIQIGWLIRAGAIEVQPDAPAANGQDRGRFVLHPEKFAPAFASLMAQVGKIKASGDVAGAKALIDDFTTGAGYALLRADQITERLLRFPKASFVYQVGF